MGQSWCKFGFSAISQLPEIAAEKTKDEVPTLSGEEKKEDVPAVAAAGKEAPAAETTPVEAAAEKENEELSAVAAAKAEEETQAGSVVPLSDEEGLVLTITSMVKAVHTFKRYKMKHDPADRAAPILQPRKTWEESFGAAKGVVLSLVNGAFPVMEWQNPSVKTIRNFVTSNGAIITKEAALEELTRTGKVVDLDLFDLACVVILCRGGQAEDALALKPNTNVFDNAMQDFLLNHPAEADSLEPDESVDLLNQLLQTAQMHLVAATSEISFC